MPDMVCCNCGIITEHNCSSCAFPNWSIGELPAESGQTIRLRAKYVALSRSYTIEECKRMSECNTSLVHDVQDIVHAQIITQLAEQELPDVDICFPEFYTKCPATWWQHFKERWFPQWLLEKYPVQYKKVHHRAILKTQGFNVIYPLLSIDRGQLHRIIPPLNNEYKNNIIKKILAQTREV